MRLLAENAAIVVACFLVLWLVSIRLRDVSFVDSWWAFGMVVLAGASLAGRAAPSPLAWLLAGLCAAWGLRLGIYLLVRWRKNGPDRRYAALLGRVQSERHWSFGAAALVYVFALQAPLQFIVALPVQIGQLGGGAIGPVGFAGAALAMLGIAFESIGDWQLARFKADPGNRDRVMDKGLWRYTRHPNYFGDACVWWGLWLIAAQSGWQATVSVIGPILLTFLLTRWSGVPTTEGRMRRKKPGYEDYVRRTPAFVPWWPKQG